MTLLERYRFHLAALLLFVILAGAAVLYLRRASPGELVLLSPTPARTWSLYIGGEVQNPGYYDVSENARLGDALRAAGGASAEGGPDQLYLFAAGEGEALVSFTPEAGPLDLNRATAEELERLPGIGPTLEELRPLVTVGEP